MSLRTHKLTKDFLDRVPSRQGKLERQVKANGHVQMYYKDNNIYSYRTLLGTLDEEEGVVLLYISTKHWSNTSREHYYSLMSHAKEHGYEVIECQSLIHTTLATYSWRIKELLGKASTAKSINYLPAVAELLTKLDRYLEYNSLHVTTHNRETLDRLKTDYSESLDKYNRNTKLQSAVRLKGMWGIYKCTI